MQQMTESLKRHPEDKAIRCAFALGTNYCSNAYTLGKLQCAKLGISRQPERRLFRLFLSAAARSFRLKQAAETGNKVAQYIYPEQCCALVQSQR